MSSYGRLLRFLSSLEEKKIAYTLGHHRDEAIMVTIAIPGERVEVEFMLDGEIEVERFRSDGSILLGESELQALLDREEQACG